MNLNNETLHPTVPLTLADLRPGDRATIAAIHPDASSTFQTRLMEIGFLVGETIFVQHEAPVSRDPIAVEVKGAVFALRRTDVKYIRVTKI